jgi:hypothetical protein
MQGGLNERYRDIMATIDRASTLGASSRVWKMVKTE